MSRYKDIYTPIPPHLPTALRPCLLTLRLIRSTPNSGRQRNLRRDLDLICVHRQAKGEHKSSLRLGSWIRSPEGQRRYYRRLSYSSSQRRGRLSVE